MGKKGLNKEKKKEVRELFQNALQEYEPRVEEACKVGISLQDESLYEDIRQNLLNILQHNYSYGKVHFYGSRIIGVGTSTSDLDIFIEIDNNFYNNRDSDRDVSVLKVIKELLTIRAQWDVIGFIYSARVPLIRATYLAMGIECNISVSNGLGVRNSIILQYLFDLQPEAKSLFHFLKLVLPQIDENFDGYLLKVLTVVFLQTQNLLPSTESMQKGLIHHTIDGWPVHYDTTRSELFEKMTMSCYKNYVPAFLKLIATGRAVYSPFSGCNKRKGKKARNNFASAFIVFGLFDKNGSHNIAQHISEANFNAFRGYCSSAFFKNSIFKIGLKISEAKINGEVDSPLALKVHQLILEKYRELEADNIGVKVLAGIVLTHGNDLETAKLICLTSGTRCIKAKNVCAIGGVVKDSHAEILARRCLIRFLLDQIELADNSYDEASIFKKSSDIKIKYELKEGVNFHLYISTAPCGDARIFAHGNGDFVHDKHPNRQSRGLLRAKIEAGEGGIPVNKCEMILVDGKRMLTMSCSDKIAKWNILGLQGALLSKIIKPIYFDSIVFGSLFTQCHTQRAFIGRLESLMSDVHPPYKLNKPNLMQAPYKLSFPSKSNVSFNWIINNGEVEITDQYEGILNGMQKENTKMNFCSRLSKRRIFECYKMRVKPPILFTQYERYQDEKLAATDYQNVKKKLFSSLEQAGKGKWIRKIPDQLTV